MPGEQRGPQLQHARPELPQHRQNQLHQQAVDRTREGISLQQVLDEGEAHRNRLGAPAERNPGEDLVPEQEDEAEEADEGGTHPRGDYQC